MLGPMLFLLFVNDLPKVTLRSNVAAFSDDTKVFNVINSPEIELDLQSELDRLGCWANKVGMTFNSKKSKVMHVTRKRKPLERIYQLGGSPLVCTKAEKDLGLWISDDLSWSKQVSEMCTKANRTLGYVRRNSRTIKSTSIRRSMYLALVRPHLGYATQVRGPTTEETH